MVDGNYTYCGDLFVMFKNIESPRCTPGTKSVQVILLQTSKLREKEIRFLVTRGSGCGEGKLDEGNQNVLTSSYKINKYQGHNVQHDKYN